MITSIDIFDHVRAVVVLQHCEVCLASHRVLNIQRNDTLRCIIGVITCASFGSGYSGCHCHCAVPRTIDNRYLQLISRLGRLHIPPPTHRTSLPVSIQDAMRIRGGGPLREARLRAAHEGIARI